MQRPATRTLRDIQIFKDLPEPARRAIEQRCHWKVCDNGSNIIHFRDTTRDVFFLVWGRARVTIYSIKGKRVIFRDIGGGEVFGEFASIDDRPRSATVEALATCFVAHMPGAEFKKVLKREQVVMEAVLTNAVAQIRALTGRIVEFNTLAVCNRIHAELLRLARNAHDQSKGACGFPLPPHAEIASRIGTHREAVARELAHLETLGVVERGRRKIVVKDVARLTRMVDEAIGE